MADSLVDGALTVRLQRTTLSDRATGALPPADIVVGRQIDTLPAQHAARTIAIRENELELCGLLRLQTRLKFVDRDLWRAQQPRPPKTVEEQQQLERSITVEMRALLVDMYVCRCGDDRLETRPDRSFHPDSAWHLHNTDFLSHNTLCVLLSLHACVYRRSVVADMGRNDYTMLDLLLTLDVIPSLAYPVDAAQKQHLRSQCESITLLTHEYYDSGATDADVLRFMRSVLSVDSLPLDASSSASCSDQRASATPPPACIAQNTVQ